MNIKLYDATWDDSEKTSFTVVVQDLDCEFLNGAVFEYTYLIGSKDDFSEISKIIQKAYEDKKLQIAEYKAPVIVEISFDELKNIALSNYKKLFETSRNNLTCDYNEDKFDCNMDAQANMTTLLTFGNMSPDSIFHIRSASEKTHTLDFKQLSELSQVMLNRVNDLYAYYWSVKDLVHKAETEEELNQIDWNF